MRKLHPATVAIRAAHKAFQSRAESVGPCFATDLRHDESAIAAHPGQSFAWMICRQGTHMARVGTAAECLAAVILRRGECEIRIPSAVIRGCASEMEEFHVWDGSTLTLARSVEHLLELYERAALRAALDEAHRTGSDEQIRALEDGMMTRGWL